MFSRKRRYHDSLMQRQHTPPAPMRNGEQTTVYIVSAPEVGVVNPKWIGMCLLFF